MERSKEAGKAESGEIKTAKAKTRKNIAELFENYDGDWQPSEYNWGEPLGREIW